MRLTLLKRWIAALAVAALLGGSTAYLTHSDGPRALAHKAGHCDLCSHFSGTTGPASAVQLPGKPVLVVRQPVTPSQAVRPFRRNVDSRLPRGPPSFELT